MERLEVKLINEGVHIPSMYVAHVQYEKEINGPRKWVRVVRNDGAELIFPISTWDDVTVDDLGNEHFLVKITVDWLGSTLRVGQ